MKNIGPSWKSKPDYHSLEDNTASPDIMWSSTQTGCGPLQRLLMDVEPMHQVTQAVSSSSSLHVTGMNRTKAASAPASLFSVSSPAADFNPSKPRSMKRTRSGLHAFDKESARASDKKPQRQSQSLELLGKGKLGTEILARVSHSLNEKAIAGFANSQKPSTRPHSSINSKQGTQLPLQSRSNMLNRCHDAHLPPTTINRRSNHDETAHSVRKSLHRSLVAESSTSLKDSPKKGRLKALLQEIDREKANMTFDHNPQKEQESPMRAAASSQKRFGRPAECQSARIGQSSGYVDQRSLVFSGATETSRPPPLKSNCDVRPNTKLVESRMNTISSATPIIRLKRSYRFDSSTSKVDSVSLCLTDDGENPHSNQPTIGTEVQESLDDDITYSEANSSSSYGDIGIEANLLEEICKEYDT